MLVTVPGAHRTTDHVVYVAGRYRNGALSDGWTDVSRCAERTFTAYHPACGCGWIGDARPATAAGLRAARHDGLRDHLLGRSATPGVDGRAVPEQGPAAGAPSPDRLSPRGATGSVGRPPAPRPRRGR